MGSGLHCLFIDSLEIHQFSDFLQQVKYDKMHQELYEKRRKIVNSEYEPTEEECDFPSDDEEDKELSKDMEEKAKIEDKEESK